MQTIKNWIFNFKRKIKYFIYPKRNRLSKRNRLNRRVANMIKDFFEYYGKEYSNFSYLTLQMTKVTVKQKKTLTIVTIELCRPGLLIGKGGKTIDALTHYLSEMLKSTVKIHIIESLLF